MSDSEEEELLLYVEINGLLDTEVLDEPQPFFKLIGLDTDHPVMQIGREVFSGEYRDVLGTAMFFEEDPLPPGVDPVFGKAPNVPLRYVCKTNKSLVMNRVFLKEKTCEGSKEKSNVVKNEDVCTNTSSSGSATNFTNNKTQNLESCEDLMSEVLTSKKVVQPIANNGSNVTMQESTPGPSWALDTPSLDVLSILSKHMDPSTEEISRLIAEQMNVSKEIEVAGFKKD